LTDPILYKVTTKVPSSYLENLFDFMQTQYLLPQKNKFTDLSRYTTDQGNFLSYSVIDEQGKKIINVKVKRSNPIEIEVSPLDDSISLLKVEEAKQDITIAIQIFEETTRNATVYFAWREGEEIVPEAYKKPEKSINRFFLETQILFFIVFIGFGMLIFISFAFFSPTYFWIAPLILIGIQFLFVFFSNNFIARTADWQITKANPIIHLLEYYLPVGEKKDFKKSYSREQLLSIKKEIYEELLAKKGKVNSEEALKIFVKFGIPCQIENLKAKRINVYELVKSIAERFHFPMPKIVVSNTMVPNAAASGPTPRRGLVLITTGLLVQLEEKEVLSVIGHEFGHLRGRDPLILYGLVSSEFLFRFYVLFPLFPLIFSSFLFFGYFWGVMVVIFFIAKFFEARADLVSANMVGNPKVLAGSLEKIGFQRLLYERTPSFRIQEWLGLDPHPPIYFRVHRLQQLGEKKVKHPLLQSIKDVVAGFLETLKR
jgi:heat shock protein HtpX